MNSPLEEAVSRRQRVVYEMYMQRCYFAVLVTFVWSTAVERKCKAVLLRCVGCSITLRTCRVENYGLRR